MSKTAPNPIKEAIDAGEYHVERIICPECGVAQQAKVAHLVPWHVRFHDCKKCGYPITETEWEMAGGN
jgi:ribosomal protein L37E